MCVAYADVELLDLMYLMCSLNRTLLFYLSVRHTSYYMYCIASYVCHLDHHESV